MARVKRNDVPVKLDAELVRKARIVTAHRGATLAEYLSELLRSHIDADYATTVSELSPPPSAPLPAKPKKRG